MNRITLLQRLKPEIKEALDQSKTDYSHSVDLIYDTLQEVDVYQDLTMSTIYSIYLFGNVERYDVDSFDIMWGDNLFLDREEFHIIDTL
jgi:hypothetical protein|tara:strand:- start:2207 stop:2473 length:267 start_codon:yes stop_codon:yes gene_type:complete